MECAHAGLTRHRGRHSRPLRLRSPPRPLVARGLRLDRLPAGDERQPWPASTSRPEVPPCADQASARRLGTATANKVRIVVYVSHLRRSNVGAPISTPCTRGAAATPAPARGVRPQPATRGAKRYLGRAGPGLCDRRLRAPARARRARSIHQGALGCVETQARQHGAPVADARRAREGVYCRTCARSAMMHPGKRGRASTATRAAECWRTPATVARAMEAYPVAALAPVAQSALSVVATPLGRHAHRASHWPCRPATERVRILAVPHSRYAFQAHACEAAHARACASREVRSAHDFQLPPAIHALRLRCRWEMAPNQAGGHRRHITHQKIIAA